MGGEGSTNERVAIERSDQIVNIPNALSVLRLLGIPLIGWLLLGIESNGWALAAIFVSGFTDWLDGYLARAWNQSTKLGALLDPLADRLYLIAIPVFLAFADILPWWAFGLLVVREVLLAGTAPLLATRGLTALPVLYIGKAATFALMSAMVWLLAGTFDNWFGTAAHGFGWGLLIWGLAMYWWTLLLYWWQTILVLRVNPRV